MFDFETFYVWAIQKYLDGSLDGNKVHEAGIAENIFKPVYTANISKDVQDKVASGMEKAKKGEVDFNAMFVNK